jgi:hypothetical protein
VTLVIYFNSSNPKGIGFLLRIILLVSPLALIPPDVLPAPRLGSWAPGHGTRSFIKPFLPTLHIGFIVELFNRVLEEKFIDTRL